MSEEKHNELLQMIQEKINFDVPVHTIMETINELTNGSITIKNLLIQKLESIRNQQNEKKL